MDCRFFQDFLLSQARSAAHRLAPLPHAHAVVRSPMHATAAPAPRAHTAARRRARLSPALHPGGCSATLRDRDGAMPPRCPRPHQPLSTSAPPLVPWRATSKAWAKERLGRRRGTRTKTESFLRDLTPGESSRDSRRRGRLR